MMNEEELQVYDNGGKTVDRYAVVVGNHVFTMSLNPLSPQGVNQFAGSLGAGIDELEEYLGVRLNPEQVPGAIKEAVQALAEEDGK